MIISEIVMYHIDEEVYFEDSIDANQLNPEARLAGNDYSLLGQTRLIGLPHKNKNTYVKSQGVIDESISI